METRLENHKIVGILAFTQIVSWGTLYYAFTVLAPEIQHEMRWSTATVFGAFSLSILMAGLVSTPVGILLDRIGGRAVMAFGSLGCGVGFLVLSRTHTLTVYFAAWAVLGIGMGLVLYEAAFATISREFSYGAREAIATLTLFAGFASTIFWPLTVRLNSAVGWRRTYLVFALAQIALCAPLHVFLPSRPRHSISIQTTRVQLAKSYTLVEAVHHPSFWKLAIAFSANNFIFSALSVHLIPLLEHFHHPLATVVFLAALIGPMQVAGRIGERVFGKKILPQTVGKVAFSVLPAAIAILLAAGSQLWAVVIFCSLYGLSNGIVTIVRGTIPRALWGKDNYGAIAGALAGPSWIAKAAGPVVTATVIQFSPAPYPIVTLLLVFASGSLFAYLAAIRMPIDESNRLETEGARIL